MLASMNLHLMFYEITFIRFKLYSSLWNMLLLLLSKLWTLTKKIQMVKCKHLEILQNFKPRSRVEVFWLV